MPKSQRPKARPPWGSSYSDPSLVLALRASLESVQNGSCRFSPSKATCIGRLAFATGMWQRPEAERRVGVAPLTRRCRARAGSSNSSADEEYFEVESIGAFVHRGALSAAVGEEFCCE